jgi:hypothetical protein
MEVWKDVELYEHGLRQFDALSPLQRDWFVIKDLDLYYEKEGGFEDYLLSGGRTAQLEWLVTTLRALGDIVSLGIIIRLRRMGESERSEMGALCDKYFAQRHQRWQLLENRLQKHGVHIDEGP